MMRFQQMFYELAWNINEEKIEAFNRILDFVNKGVDNSHNPDYAVRYLALLEVVFDLSREQSTIGGQDPTFDFGSLEQLLRHLNQDIPIRLGPDPQKELFGAPDLTSKDPGQTQTIEP